MAMSVSWRVCHFLTCFCFQYSEKLLTSVAKSAVLTCTSKRPIISVSVVAKTRTNDIQGLRNIINTSILSISMPNKHMKANISLKSRHSGKIVILHHFGVSTTLLNTGARISININQYRRGSSRIHGD